MTTPIDIRERTASRSPASFGFSMEGGKVAGPWWLQDGSTLGDSVQAIIGDVAPAGAGPRAGALTRSLPLRHPAPDFGKILHVDAITGANGIGTGTAAPSDGVGNVPEFYTDWESYEANLSFKPFPYQVEIADNDIIIVSPLIWTDADGATIKSVATTEYTRWVEWIKEPANEFLVAEQGAMYVVDSSNPIDKWVKGNVHGSEFVGKPRIPVMGSKLSLIWHNVPASYVWSSKCVFDKYLWRVNDAVFGPYKTGEMLFMNVTWKTYLPWRPSAVPGVNGDLPGGVEMLADIKFEFLIRQNIVVLGPDTSGNRIYKSPHNAAPHFLDRKWRSLITADPTTPNDTSKWRPPFDSFPIEILFTDPNYVNLP